MIVNHQLFEWPLQNMLKRNISTFDPEISCCQTCSTHTGSSKTEIKHMAGATLPSKMNISNEMTLMLKKIARHNFSLFCSIFIIIILKMEEETFFWLFLFRVHKLVVKIIYVPRTHCADCYRRSCFAIVLFHSGSGNGQSRRRNQNSRKSIRAKNETAKEKISKAAHHQPIRRKLHSRNEQK